MQILEKLQNKQIAIVGYGREGRSTAHFLVDNGISSKDITILDSKKNISTAGLKYIGGKNYLSGLEVYDVIFLSPGISPTLPELEKYTGIVTSQTQLFFDVYPGKVIGITGTKGKTTISTLIYEVLEAAGYTVALLGNGGAPLLGDNVEKNYDYVVCELSSYQLHNLTCELEIAIINNLYHEHHIERHGSKDAYFKDKCNIYTGAKHTLIGSQIAMEQEQYLPETYTLYGNQGSYTYSSGSFYLNENKSFSDDKILLAGDHNKYNICAVIGICDILGIDNKILQQVLVSFTGVKHRLEHIGTYGGIQRINDAIATTPESTIAALEAYGEQIDTIFLGGKDGGYDFSTLLEKIHEYGIRNIILFPDSGERIAQTYDLSSYTTFTTRSMKEAVSFAAEHTKIGKIALLSCASPSYSIWKNFEEKGELFEKYVSLI